MSDNQSIIKLRLIKAKATFSEVELLMLNKLYNAALNRLNYSCFYATTALLLFYNLKPKTHSSTSALLHHYLVKQDNFDPVKSSFYTRLMQQRERDDYNDFLIVNKDLVENIFSLLKNILNT